MASLRWLEFFPNAPLQAAARGARAGGFVLAGIAAASAGAVAARLRLEPELGWATAAGIGCCTCEGASLASASRVGSLCSGGAAVCVRVRDGFDDCGGTMIVGA